MIKSKKKLLLSLAIVVIAFFAGFAIYRVANDSGEIYLYGEAHAVPVILDKELELWNEYYHEEGMRDLFVELPYYHAEFLNIWMQSDSDDILDELWEELKGTYGGESVAKDFYRSIKKDCPETIFHGTDVGHLYDITGERYLAYLREHGQENSSNYKRAQEVMEQGEHYYKEDDRNVRDVYREGKLVENFIWEFEQLKGKDIMGIYGGAHTNKGYSKELPSMAEQLKEKYQGKVHTEDLSKGYDEFTLGTKDILEVNGKKYEISLLVKARSEIEGKSYDQVEVWELEEGSGDFEDMPIGETVLSDSAYPFIIGYGKIYVLDFYTGDEFGERMIFRSDETAMDDGSIIARELLYQ